MIASGAFGGRSYAVLGLARSGRAAVATLLASGARVLAWDKSEPARAALPAAEGLTVDDPLTADLSGFAGIVVSPGVPLNRHPIAARAADAGVPVIGDIELFAQARPDLPPHKVVGITGTNGKSTTTALVHHILASAGIPAAMAGNIGYPILARDPLPAGGVYVLELSSYQLDLTHGLDCDVAVLLNITPDHLDRYGSFEAYRASKLRLFEMQSRDHRAIYHFDSDEAEHVLEIRGDDAGGFWFTADRVGHLEHQAEWPALQGPHNALNAAAAVMTAHALQVPDHAIAQHDRHRADRRRFDRAGP